MAEQPPHHHDHHHHENLVEEDANSINHFRAYRTAGDKSMAVIAKDPSLHKHLKGHSGEWLLKESSYESQIEIREEFSLLNELTNNSKTDQQLKQDNNRDNFIGTSPFKENAVELEGHLINASKITSPLDGTTLDFISTQTPLPRHLGAYWKMIWTF